jgi:hypothetical protein
MFPVLVLAYWHLALSEEREVRKRFGAEWDAYARGHAALRPEAGPGTESARFAVTRTAEDSEAKGQHL